MPEHTPHIDSTLQYPRPLPAGPATVFDTVVDGVHLTALASRELRTSAEFVLGAFASLGIGQLHDGTSLQLGFNRFWLQRSGDGAFTIMAPDYTADPLHERTIDLSTTLWLHEAQADLLEVSRAALLGTRLDHEISIQRDLLSALTAGEPASLCMQRVAEPKRSGDGQWISGWTIASSLVSQSSLASQSSLLSREASPFETITAGRLAALAPHLAAALQLPRGYLATFAGRMLTGVWYLSPEAWSKALAEPRTRSMPEVLEQHGFRVLRFAGRPTIALFPELVRQASELLGIEPAVAAQNSSTDAREDLFFVWTGGRGGAHLALGGDGSYRIRESSETVASLRDEYLSGRRTTSGDAPVNHAASAVAALIVRLRGGELAQTTPAGLSEQQLERLVSRPFISTTPDEIEARLQACASGTYLLVGFDRAVGPGHWCLAFRDDDRVITLDPFGGVTRSWPPENAVDATAWIAEGTPLVVPAPPVPPAPPTSPVPGQTAAMEDLESPGDLESAGAPESTGDLEHVEDLEAFQTIERPQNIQRAQGAHGTLAPPAALIAPAGRSIVTQTVHGVTIHGEVDSAYATEAEEILRGASAYELEAFHNGFGFAYGFWWFNLRAFGDDYRMSATDLTAEGIATNTWDLTAPARLRHEQKRLHGFLKTARWTTVFFLKTVRIAKGALDAEDVALSRHEPADENDSGWRIGPAHAADAEIVPAHELFRRAPRLPRYFTLPIGYSVVARHGASVRIVDETGTVRFGE